MEMRKAVMVCLILFGSLFGRSQTCERFDRVLFPFLPKYVPNDINCRDSNGKKQGWWIYYDVSYNPRRIPDGLDSGNFVASYLYGKYSDDRKIDKWVKFQNIHQCYVERVDSYYYKKDTVCIYSSDAFRSFRQITQYIKDSTIILSKSTWGDDTVCIYCDKKRGKGNRECRMEEYHKVVKEFPFKDFEINYLMVFDQMSKRRRIRPAKKMDRN